jgi:hypothetical protein
MTAIWVIVTTMSRLVVYLSLQETNRTRAFPPSIPTWSYHVPDAVWLYAPLRGNNGVTEAKRPLNGDARPGAACRAAPDGALGPGGDALGAGAEAALELVAEATAARRRVVNLAGIAVGKAGGLLCAADTISPLGHVRVLEENPELVWGRRRGYGCSTHGRDAGAGCARLGGRVALRELADTDGRRRGVGVAEGRRRGRARAHGADAVVGGAGALVELPLGIGGHKGEGAGGEEGKGREELHLDGEIRTDG